MGNISAIVICAVLVVIAMITVKSYAKKLTSGCCGTGGDVPKRIKVTDRDIQQYPYTTILHVDGMTCKNCVRRVENALNGIDGVWAEVRLQEEVAKVYMKENVSTERLCIAIEEAGYHAKRKER